MVDELNVRAQWKMFTLDKGMKHVDVDFLDTRKSTPEFNVDYGRTYRAERECVDYAGLLDHNGPGDGAVTRLNI